MTRVSVLAALLLIATLPSSAEALEKPCTDTEWACLEQKNGIIRAVFDAGGCSRKPIDIVNAYLGACAPDDRAKRCAIVSLIESKLKDEHCQEFVKHGLEELERTTPPADLNSYISDALRAHAGSIYANLVDLELRVPPGVNVLLNGLPLDTTTQPCVQTNVPSDATIEIQDQCLAPVNIKVSEGQSRTTGGLRRAVSVDLTPRIEHVARLALLFEGKTDPPDRVWFDDGPELPAAPFLAADGADLCFPGFVRGAMARLHVALPGGSPWEEDVALNGLIKVSIPSPVSFVVFYAGATRKPAEMLVDELRGPLRDRGISVIGPYAVESKDAAVKDLIQRNALLGIYGERIEPEKQRWWLVSPMLAGDFDRTPSETGSGGSTLTGSDQILGRLTQERPRLDASVIEPLAVDLDGFPYPVVFDFVTAIENVRRGDTIIGAGFGGRHVGVGSWRDLDQELATTAELVLDLGRSGGTKTTVKSAPSTIVVDVRDGLSRARAPVLIAQFLQIGRDRESKDITRCSAWLNAYRLFLLYGSTAFEPEEMKAALNACGDHVANTRAYLLWVTGSDVQVDRERRVYRRDGAKPGSGITTSAK